MDIDIKRSLKEKRFIDAYIKNQGNLTQAYLELSPGCSLASARVLGYRWLQKVNIPAQELLDRLDLTDVCLGQKLKEGLEANKIISGMVTPDYNIRAKYLDMAFKLKDKYPSEKHKLEEKNEVIVIGRPKEGNATEKLIKKINDLAKKTDSDN